MSLQWLFVATCLYIESAIVILLLLPIFGPFLSRMLNTRFAQQLRAKANIFFMVIVLIFGLLFMDSIREVRKYSNEHLKDPSKPHAEIFAQVKQFRSQRNFYVAGFALFFWFVIHRLIRVLPSSSNVDENRRHVSPSNTSGASSTPSAPVDDELYITRTQHNNEIDELRRMFGKKLEDQEEIRQRYQESKTELENLREEYQKLTNQMNSMTNDESRKDQ